MRVIDILRQRESDIVDEAARFAQSLAPFADESVDSAVLRDHLPSVLRAMVRDLERPQTREEEIAKSEGRAPMPPAETAAEIHGRMRAESGLSVGQVVAEYRVLRSVVSRMWSDSAAYDSDSRHDMIRFNAAIDQAIAESVSFHSAEMRRWRYALLAVIAHDLRGPLQSMAMISEFLGERLRNTEHVPHIDRLASAAERLRILLDSLLDYSTTKFGRPMRLNLAQADLASALEAELDLVRSAHPTVSFILQCDGNLSGLFDENRVREAFSNLLSNAVQYSEPSTPVRAIATEAHGQIRLEVRNHGEAIPAEAVHSVFEPLRRADETRRAGTRHNLGIGLFIVREVARAHGGSVGVTYDDGEVVFWLSLSKKPELAGTPSRPPTL
jgi:signal transduction histidine kinase